MTHGVYRPGKLPPLAFRTCRMVDAMGNEGLMRETDVAGAMMRLEMAEAGPDIESVMKLLYRIAGGPERQA